MSQPIVLDACTIINLLRIDDEEDEFLYKHIIAQNLHIAEKVHVEVRNNYSKNQLSQKQNNYISRCVVDLLNHLCQTGGYHRDDDIIKDLSKQLFVEISNYTGHIKENGELYSTALSLIVSRYETEKVLFCTDDVPATNILSRYFQFQQIGSIMDTVDLLVYLYWSSSDFDRKLFDRYLSKLWADVNQPLKLFVDEIQKLKDSFSLADNKDKLLRMNVDRIIRGYYQYDGSQIIDAVTCLKKNKTGTKVANTIERFSHVNIEMACPLISKIQSLRLDMKKNELFKIA